MADSFLHQSTYSYRGVTLRAIPMSLTGTGVVWFLRYFTYERSVLYATDLAQR